MHPLISLIIPCHNQTHLLPRLLDSVLEQNFDALETIIVDDCSDMPCAELADAYTRKGLTIRLIRTPLNVRTKAARLIGVKAARAEHVAFADADDVLLGKSTLARQLSLMEDNGADIVHMRREYLRPDGSVEPHPANLHGILQPFLEGREIFSRYVKEAMRGCAVWAKLYRKSLWEKIAPEAEASRVGRYLEDFYLSALLYFHARRYVGNNEIVYGHYYESKPSRSFGRAATLYVIIRELVPYLRRNGCPEKDTHAFATAVVHLMRSEVGRYCKLRGLNEYSGIGPVDGIGDDTANAMEQQYFFKAMLMSMRFCDYSLQGCEETIFPGEAYGRLFVTPFERNIL